MVNDGFPDPYGYGFEMVDAPAVPFCRENAINRKFTPNQNSRTFRKFSPN
jgi:hypothetical protein